MTVEVAAKQVIDRLTYFRQRLSNISQQLRVMEDVDRYTNSSDVGWTAQRAI